MWALIAFIALGVVVTALIEINERKKAKKKIDNCTQEKAGEEACSDCGLVSVCEKKNDNR